jgi:hypothetical protein
MFTRQRLDPLLQKFLREILVLDPTLRTVDEAQNKYAPLLDSIYGPGTVGHRHEDRQFRAGLLIIISTLLILLGWIVTIDVFSDVTLLGEHRASFPVETLRYGFLGAYFFCLNMIFRRYVRADLSPKAYTHVAVRLLTTFTLCVTIDLVPLPNTPHHLAGLLAFTVGLFPDTGIALIISTVRHALPDAHFPATRDDHPITDLQGINLYEQARLLEEGIENVENLAHYNLVELMLRTRIPTPRIVDLFDQAILYLHLDSDRTSAQQAIGNLRACGVRTATDLCSVYNAARKRDTDAQVAGDGDATHVLRLLDGPEPNVTNRLQLVMDAFRDDDWLASVAYWRTMSANTDIVTDPNRFYGELQPYTPASSQV